MNYRPYKDLEEFRKYYTKNKVIVNKISHIKCICGCNVYDWGVTRLYIHCTDASSYECCLYSFEELFNMWEYEDGTPCGVYE